MTLKRIRLELARDPDFPEGSRSHGYEFVAPLDPEGRLLPAEWRAERGHCRVTRFWAGEASQHGRLMHRPGGSWVFDYDPDRSDDDEVGFKLGNHRFAPGEYVSFTEQDEALRCFRVASVQAV